ncbi:MAG TPA: class I SAM-dependent methyltransferase [Candidatus Binataceae bacterium]|nr:class I SAM-dependent methyltransferase [Candidatus Binataceae bacterium]
MNEQRRIQRARTFDEVAELYDRARTGYPETLFDALFAMAEIAPAGAEIVEAGCGTGQATVSLARRGCRLVCVEIGANLARIARRNLAKFPLVTVVTAPFEDWDSRGSAFDMVFAASAWHWIDPSVRYARAASVLRPAGTLAFTTWAHAFPPGFDPFFSQIQQCYDAIGHGGIAWPAPPPEEIGDERIEIEGSGFFDTVRIAHFVSTIEFTAEEYVALMNTASDHRLMEPDKRERLFAEMRRLINARPGGRIRKHNLRILHVARRGR